MQQHNTHHQPLSQPSHSIKVAELVQRLLHWSPPISETKYARVYPQDEIKLDQRVRESGEW
jgi:hypothetical protein